MTVQFRNLDFDSTAPVDEWPAEAIETVIDRGSLSDWRRLAEAIRQDPWGPAARTTENVVSWGEHYGVDALMGEAIRRARDELTLAGRAEYAAQIRSWRAQAGMTLRQFARAAGYLCFTAVRLRARKGRPHHRRPRPSRPRRATGGRRTG